MRVTPKPPPVLDPDDRPYLTTSEAADFLRLAKSTLDRWRCVGRTEKDGMPGPPYLVIARRIVRYRREDLVAWVEANSEVRTSNREDSMP